MAWWFVRSGFLRKTLVCRDCYRLYRDPAVYTACRDNCFFNKAYEVNKIYISS